MRILLFLFILISLCSGQIIQDNFNNFFPKPSEYPDFRAYYVFDETAVVTMGGDSIINSLVNPSASNRLSVWDGYSSYSDIIDSLNVANPFYNGGYVLRHDGASEGFAVTAGASYFAPSDSSFTVIAWVRPDSDEDYGTYIQYGRTTLDVYELRFSSGGTDCRLNFYTTDAGGNYTAFNTGNESDMDILDGTNNGILAGTHRCVFEFANRLTSIGNVSPDDTSYANLYRIIPEYSIDTLRQVVDQSAESWIRDIVSANERVGIFMREDSSLWFGGDIAGLIYACGDKEYSEAEMRDIYYAPYGWHTKNGNSFRSIYPSNTWYAGFYDGDTLYTAIPDTSISANRAFKLTYKAKGAASDDTVFVYIGDENGAKSSLITQAVTTDFSDYSADLGNLPISSDSLYFYTSSGDTIYIDDVELSASSSGSRMKSLLRL